MTDETDEKSRKQFVIIEFIIFAFLAIVTLIEVFSFPFFNNVFNFLKEPVSWFFGLTIGAVIPKWINPLKEKFNKAVLGKIVSQESFIFFILNLVIMTFVILYVKKWSLSLLVIFPTFFHVLFVQWMIIVYMWHKFSNQYEIEWRYVIATEVFALIFATVITFVI